MSISVFDANELGTVLACSMAAVTTEGRLQPAEQTRLGLSIAKGLADVARLNRKTYATRYGEIPLAAVKAEEIVAAAQQVDVFAEPELCATPGSYFKSSLASSLAYNTDLRAHPKVKEQLEGLHEVMTAFARQQYARVEKARAATARDRHVADVNAGRYPWLSVRPGRDGGLQIEDAGTVAFSKELGKALKAATGRAWSVSRSRGTASSWVRVDAPPARRTCEWDGTTPAPEGRGYACLNDREVLGKAMRVAGGVAHPQGESIAPSSGCREQAYDLVKGHPEPATCRTDFD